MDEELFPRDKRDDPNEGVRIIGAEEAEKAIEREDVARRLPQDAPRFGDRPETPPDDGPRPAIRFPLSGSAEPPSVGPVEPVNMPHWTEPATGEVPAVLASGSDEEDDLDAWSAFSSSQPRWRGEGTDFERDEYDDFSRLADDETRVGALDPNRPGPEEFFEFDEEPEFEPAATPGTRAISSDPRRTRQRPRTNGAFDRPNDPGRDMQQAVAVGAGMAALFLLLAKAGPKYVMVIAVAVIVLAAIEMFTALRRAGYKPATLLGITAAVTLPLAAYWKGEAAYPVVLMLMAAFGLLWYLTGAGGDDSPILGVASTMLVVGYVVVLGSFAALMLAVPRFGVGLLWGAVLTSVAYDVGAFFVGRSLGTRPMSNASPNKTFEGLAGGWIASVLAAVVIVGLIAPWDDLGIGQKAMFGLAAAIAATLGDLCESLIKRDLGVKDMGTLLPGHGGVLDRFDALLFVLPATYYAARILIF